MTFYHNDSWIAFLCEHIVQQSLKLSKDNCPGCREDMQSAILHLHEQQSLLEKIRNSFDQVRGIVLLDIDTYYSKFEAKLPHSNDKKKDKIIYCNLARTFLLTTTPDSLYFGRYLSAENDSYIGESFCKVKKGRANICTKYPKSTLNSTVTDS